MEIGETLEVSGPQDFAEWLEAHGTQAKEIWPVIYKKSSGKQTVTYPQLVEVAIRYGWIDVMEKSVDRERYALRFMPRRKKSNWTEANREIARRLLDEGRMTEAGKAVLPEDLRAASVKGSEDHPQKTFFGPFILIIAITPPHRSHA